MLAETMEYHPKDNMESKGKLKQDSKRTLFGWTISTKWTISEIDQNKRDSGDQEKAI